MWNEPVTPGRVEFDSRLLYEAESTRFGAYESWAAGHNEATAARLMVSDFDAAFAEPRENSVVFEDYDHGDDFRTEDGVPVSPDGEKTVWFEDSEATSSPLDRATRLLAHAGTRRSDVLWGMTMVQLRGHP